MKKRKNNYDIWCEKWTCMNYQSCKVDVWIIRQTMETMIKFINPKRTSILHGKKNWVNLIKWWLLHGPEDGTIISSTLMKEMVEKHKGMFGKVAKELN